MNPKPVRTAGNSAFANPPDNIRCGKSGMSANSISDGLLRFLHLYFTRRTGFSFVRVALALYGQWHSLSDPELEHSLITRIDFNLFCRFDELSIPDYSTLCRYRNWLAQDDTLSELLKLINCRLTEKGLKVKKASAAVIDATIIQTAGSEQRQTIEVDEERQVSGQTTPSKDKDTRWTKKNGLYRLGYKQHTRTDAEGYIEKLYITPANIPVFSLTNREKRSPFENRIVSSLYISTKFTELIYINTNKEDNKSPNMCKKRETLLYKVSLGFNDLFFTKF